MNMYFILAWRNIWRNKKRTIITAASIGFAVFFACIMQSMQLGSYTRMIDNSVRFYTGHLGIHQADYWEEKVLDNSFELNDALTASLAHDDIVAAVPRISSFALASAGSKTKGVMVSGIDPGAEAKLTNLQNKVIEGAYLGEGDLLLGEGLAKYLSVAPGDTLVLIGQGYHGLNAAGKYPIAGILRFPAPELNQQAVYMSLGAAQYFYGATDRITSYSLLLEDERNLNEVKKALGQRMVGADLSIMNWKEMMPELVQSIELDYYGGIIMIYILYAVIGFGIFGTLLMMAKERTYEFGILISIGMKKHKIQWMVALEIITLSLLGVVAGVVASLPILIYLYINPIYVTGKMAEAYEKFGMEPILPFSLDPLVFYQQAIAILIIALVLGIYPLLAIRRLKIIKALRA